MRGFAGLSVALCLCCGLPATAQQQQTEKLPLRFSDSSTVVHRLKDQFPNYASDIFAVEAENSLLVIGTRQEVADLKKALAKLDAPTRAIQLTMRLLRFSYDGAGNWDVETVGQPCIQTTDGNAAKIGVSGDAESYSIEVMPHANADGSVALTAELRLPANEGNPGVSAKAQRVARNNQRVTLLGLTSSTDPRVQAEVRQGRLSKSHEKRVDYFLQITPRLQPTPKMP